MKSLVWPKYFRSSSTFIQPRRRRSGGFFSQGANLSPIIVSTPYRNHLDIPDTDPIISTSRETRQKDHGDEKQNIRTPTGFSFSWSVHTISGVYLAWNSYSGIYLHLRYRKFKFGQPPPPPSSNNNSRTESERMKRHPLWVVPPFKMPLKGNN